MRPEINIDSWHFKFLSTRFGKNYLTLQTRSMRHYYTMFATTVFVYLMIVLVLTIVGLVVGLSTISFPDILGTSFILTISDKSLLDLFGLTILGLVVTVIGVVSIYYFLTAIEKIWDYLKKKIFEWSFSPDKVPVFYSKKKDQK